MNTKPLWSFTFCLALATAMLSCGDDDNNNKPECKTFSSADSVCFCTIHPEDNACVKPSVEFIISRYTEEKATLTPHTNNGTIWSKGFTIGNSIYVIDRESSPHAFWKFDLKANSKWTALADFPGTRYGLIGSANGKGYASSYASKKFWEYDPTTNEWTPMPDLPFSTAETHWVEYEGKFYVPDNNGIYEFNATTKEWSKYSEQISTGFGAIFLLGDDVYWWNVNDNYMNRFNLATKTYEQHPVPTGFNTGITFNSPFVLDDVAYILYRRSVWIFNPNTRTWSEKDTGKFESYFADDVFVLDKKAYILDDGYLNVFEVAE